MIMHASIVWLTMYKQQISKHDTRFPWHFTKILNPYKSTEHNLQVSYTWENKNLF